MTDVSSDVRELAGRVYQYGFVTDLETEVAPRGLNEDVIRLISAKKNEPDWLLEWRLMSYRHWLTLEEPRWQNVHHPPIDYQDIIYYAAPKPKTELASLDEVDPELRAMFDKLGISLAEQERLGGVAVDAVVDSVSVATTFKAKLAEVGVIFSSFSEAVQNHPDLVRTYLGSVVPYRDNIHATPQLRRVLRRLVLLEQDCKATSIPGGQKLTLRRGERVVVTQALGGSFTVQTEQGYLARIDAQDADALGLEGTVVNEGPADSRPFELQHVIEQLKTVFDPEIPVNVVDLGLLYACDARPLADGGHRVEIKMSMTAPGCGTGDVLKDDARAGVQTVPGVSDVDIELVWDPPWDPSRMSDAARLQLGML